MPAAPRERSGLTRAVAAQIRAEQSAARLTNDQTAKMARITPGTYRKLRDATGSADAEQLYRLCSRVYGISLREFFSRVEARLAVQGDDEPRPDEP